MTIEELLMIVQKTNPDMTKEKLVAELNKENHVKTSLYLMCQNRQKKER